MLNYRKQLPPLDPLIAFEAAARHLSFTTAAKELNLSQAAVSQQIRNLELKLGTELFIRSHRAVQLSTKGREFQHTVASVFQQLSMATIEVKTPSTGTQLSVSADQSMASMWLMPKLPEFQASYPELKIRIKSSDSESECLASDIHIALIHGVGSWPGFHCEKLFDEEVFPVCSPGYLEKSQKFESLSSLVNETLLDLDDNHWNWMNWRNWFSSNDVHLPAHRRGLQVNSYPLLIEAARNSHGVALGWKYLVDDDLSKGRLVKPVNISVKTSYGYYLVWPDQQNFSAVTDSFRTWCKDKFSC